MLTHAEFQVESFQLNKCGEIYVLFTFPSSSLLAVVVVVVVAPYTLNRSRR